MRLKKSRTSITSITFTDLISVELVGLHIYEESAESVANSTASSLSGDRSLGLGDAIGNRREYEMMLSVL